MITNTELERLVLELVRKQSAPFLAKVYRVNPLQSNEIARVARFIGNFSDFLELQIKRYCGSDVFLHVDTKIGSKIICCNYLIIIVNFYPWIK